MMRIMMMVMVMMTLMMLLHLGELMKAKGNTHHDAAAVGVGVGRVLPGLRQEAVVPVDVVGVVADLSLLHVLLDRGLGLVLAQRRVSEPWKVRGRDHKQQHWGS